MATKVEEFDLYACTLCSESEGIERSDFRKHMAEAHEEDLVDAKLRPILHGDGAGFFFWSYEVLNAEGETVGSRTVQRRRGR
jgi:hypothetical protein